ncbi:hypothetical protein [Thermus oshimai]
MRCPIQEGRIPLKPIPTCKPDHINSTSLRERFVDEPSATKAFIVGVWGEDEDPLPRSRQGKGGEPPHGPLVVKAVEALGNPGGVDNEGGEEKEDEEG